MSVTILLGDMRERLADVPDASVDAIITDPPYGETSLKWDKRVSGWQSLLRRVLKPGGSMWVFGSLRLFMETAGEYAEWKMSHDVVWEKHNGTGLFNDRFRRVHELTAHFYPADVPWSSVYVSPQYTNDARARVVRKKGRPAQWIGATGETVYRSEDGGPRLMRSVMYVRSEHGRALHPTQKPIGMIEPLLAYCCPKNGTVLDPFAGSGSTGIAAKILGRNAILIERNPEYAAIAEKRIKGDAPLFAEVAA